MSQPTEPNGRARSGVAPDVVLEVPADPDAEWLALRRRMGIATCLLGATAAMAVCLLEWAKGAPDAFEVYGLPAIAAWLLIVAASYRGRHAAVAEWGLLCAGTGGLLGLFYDNLLRPHPGIDAILTCYEVLAWLPALYLFGFALLPKTRALVFSLGVLAATSILSFVGPAPVPAESRLGFLEIYVANLGSIGFIFTLSALKERYVETHHLARQLRHSADTDYLTGIRNRRWMERRLDGELVRCAALGQPLALVMLDVDRFKIINDEFGHDAGDRVLQRVARVLEVSIRNRDLLARWGGEEFVLALPGVDLTGAVEVAERIRRVLEAQCGSRGPAATASLGVSAASVGDCVDSLVRRADAALRIAKREGRNRVVSQAA